MHPQAVGLPAALVPAAVCADNLSMAVFLAVLSAAGRIQVDHTGSAGVEAATNIEGLTSTAANQAKHVQQASEDPEAPATASSLALTVATASVACALSKVIAAQLQVPSLHLMFMAVLAAALSAGVRTVAAILQSRSPSASNASSTPPASLYAGASHLGSFLMTLFFVVIGCNAGDVTALVQPASAALLLFLGIMVGVHWAVLAAANVVLRLPLPALVLGSNANLGGPATAAAMAAAKGGSWARLVQPAMLCGSLGYALGTLAGLGVARTLGVPLAA